MAAIPPLAPTRGMLSSVFDEHQEQMKKQLLPKDLANRSEKLPKQRIEAEVVRILSAPPRPNPYDAWQNILPQLQVPSARDMQREYERMLMSDVRVTPYVGGKLGL